MNPLSCSRNENCTSPQDYLGGIGVEVRNFWGARTFVHNWNETEVQRHMRKSLSYFGTCPQKSSNDSWGMIGDARCNMSNTCSLQPQLRVQHIHATWTPSNDPAVFRLWMPGPWLRLPQLADCQRWQFLTEQNVRVPRRILWKRN